MKPALAQVCTLNAPLETDVADYAAGKCTALELWLGKVEQYVQQSSPENLRNLLAEHEMAVPVASYQGGLLTSQGERRAEHWQHFRQRLDLCKALGVETLVVAADLTDLLTQQDLDRASASLTEAAQSAGQAGVRLALEFQSSASFCNNLQTAAAMIAKTGSPHLGLCLDLFHFFTGPSKHEDLGYLTCDNLFHVQLSDLSGVARELATDADRILPGDGELYLTPILERLRQIDYQDYVSIELMNPHIWQVPPLQFGEIAMTALRKTLGQADPGVSSSS